MSQNRGLRASEWEDYFREAHVCIDELNSARSQHSRSIAMGKFLARLVGREVPVEVEGRRGTAVLRLEAARANQNQYHFEVRWEDAADENHQQDPHPVWHPEEEDESPVAADVVADTNDSSGTGNNEDW